MSDALLSSTSRKTTLMSTCGAGASRLAITRRICSVVSLSAMITMLCVTGSTEMTALPTVPLLLYWPLLVVPPRFALLNAPPNPPNPPKPPTPPPPPPGRTCAWSSKVAHKRKIRTPPRCFLKKSVFIICLFILEFRVLELPHAGAATAADSGAADSGGGGGRAHGGRAGQSALLERAVLRRTRTRTAARRAAALEHILQHLHHLLRIAVLQRNNRNVLIAVRRHVQVVHHPRNLVHQILRRSHDDRLNA